MTSGIAVFAVAAFQNARHVEQALRSLLDQGEVRVVVVDDCSDDGSYERLLTFADAERVTVLRNERRLGMPRNWQRAAEEALARHPEAEWFAWGSDHDIWAEGWFEALGAALEADADAPFAYPTPVAVDDAGAVLSEFSRPGKPGDPVGGLEHAGRVTGSSRPVKPGDAIYGLFRASVVRECLPVPVVPAFDRVILARAAARGRAIHVDRPLWLRRYSVTDGAPTRPSRARQRRGFWPERRPPWWALLPVHWVHGVVLCRDAIRDRGQIAPGMTFARARIVVGHYAEGRKRRRHRRREAMLRTILAPARWLLRGRRSS